MTVHVVGAGLAGLSAAVRVAQAGARVVLSEAAGQAGGRCRSYMDATLGLTIDNGNHLVMSGNGAVHDYLKTIGAEARVSGPASAQYDFMELATRRKWQLRPSAGRMPWWLLSRARRVPETGLLDYLVLARLMKRAPGKRVGEVIRCEGRLWERLLRPLLVAALNTEPEMASADLAGAIIRETLAKGGNASRPQIAEPHLAAAYVDPALRFIETHGGEVRLGRRLRALKFSSPNSRLEGLSFADGDIALSPEDRVILAVPPWIASDLVPGLDAPDAFHAIVNGHFRCAPPPGAPTILGAIGGTVEWIFSFEDRISVTISCADRLVDQNREALARLFWDEVSALLGLPPDLPPWQIVKEKRATFAATPEQNAKRPRAETRWENLALAGDWIDTGLPATIEGAIRSGRHAAALALPGSGA